MWSIVNLGSFGVTEVMLQNVLESSTVLKSVYISSQFFVPLLFFPIMTYFFFIVSRFMNEHEWSVSIKERVDLTIMII